jgi:DNA-binding LytR/AlgR family response regulator
MNEILKTTISLSVERQMFPIAYEMAVQASVILAKINQLGEIKEVSNRYKPVLVPDRNGFMQLKAEDIIYLEADGAYCRIFLKNGKNIHLSEPLWMLVDDFCCYGIVRCHKSYAVNIREILSLAGNSIRLTNGIDVKMGRAYKDAVHACFNHRGTKSKKW